MVIAGSGTLASLLFEQRIIVAEWGGVFNSTAGQARVTPSISCHCARIVSDKMVLRSCWKSRHKNSGGPAPCWIRPGLVAVLCLCVIQIGCGSGAVGETKNVVQKDAEFDVTYNDTVTSENQTIYAFNHTVSRNKVSLHCLTIAISHLIMSNNVECIVMICFLNWVSDRGSTCVRVVPAVGEPYPICGATEASCAVLSSPSHTQRTVSVPTLHTLVIIMLNIRCKFIL